MEGHLWHVGCWCPCIVMEGDLGPLKVLVSMYSDGGSFVAYRVFMFMYSDGGSFMAYMVSMFMYSDGGSIRAYRVFIKNSQDCTSHGIDK